MREGGKKLARVKEKLMKKVGEGVSAIEIEELACKLIEDEGAESSFKMVPRYRWATCVNVNEGVVHGIPNKQIIFKKGDIVSVDVGIYYKGFHTDTSFSIGVGIDHKKSRFLEAGKKAFEAALSKVVPGMRIFDISEAIEKSLENAGYTPIRALVGHGVGRELHEDPQIPCFTHDKRDDTPEISEGHVYAIEVMYAMGKPDVRTADDGWTIETRDGKISGLFEETVAAVKTGPEVLTRLEKEKSSRKYSVS